jgi:hypothetical protein
MHQDDGVAVGVSLARDRFSGQAGGPGAATGGHTKSQAGRFYVKEVT